MQHVLVLDADLRPLMPCRPARARLLLTQGKAVVHHRVPFIIRLKVAYPDAQVTPLRVKIDPGSRTTGLAVVNDTNGDVVLAAELVHRGEQIHQKLTDRHAQRRSRRQRQTRYRPARWQNRRRPDGWLPPSLASRVQNTVTWVQRFHRWCPVGGISFEAVRFDTQLFQNPDMAGLDYQHGTLAGTEVREYLLLKWGYRCAYCGKTAQRWEVDHIHPRSRGGSNRPSNLALSCHGCNHAKGDRTAVEFGHPQVQAQAKAPLKDAAAVNSTRQALHQRLLSLGMPVETGTGGLTKFHRTQRKLPKTHWLDAACVGASTPTQLRWQDVAPLRITAQGWQRRQMCLLDKYGFPRAAPKERSRVQGFKTGDLVRAVVPSGAKAGTYVGKVAVRARGSFNITTAQGVVTDISYRYCQPLQRGDGYSYQKGARAFLPLP